MLVSLSHFESHLSTMNVVLAVSIVVFVTWCMIFEGFETAAVRQISTAVNESNMCSTNGVENECRDDSGGVYPILDSVSGAIRSVGTGITVQRGTQGTLNFSLTLEAVRADELANMDSGFVDVLGVADKSIYTLSKASYSGDLGVPFLRFIGADLKENVTECDMNVVRLTQPNYDSYAWAARTLLQESQVKRIRVSGSRNITGRGFIPRTVVAYIRVAEVRLADGSCKRVVSTDVDDVVIGTENTRVVYDTGADELVVEEIDG